MDPLTIAFASMGLLCVVQFLMIVASFVRRTSHVEEMQTLYREGFRCHKEFYKEFRDEVRQELIEELKQCQEPEQK